MKLSRSNNDYFDVTLQTKDKTLRGISFSPEKMKIMKSRYESSSPIKLTSYAIKRNRYTDEDEVHINKRTKITDPATTELDFDIKQVKSDEDLATLTTVNDIIEHNTKSSKVNISGRVSFDASPETIQANGKTLQKLETVLTDETGSIRLVLWEKDIDRVQNGLTYKITQALVKNFNSNKYITLNRQSLIAEAQITIQRSDEQLLDNQLNTVSCPVDGVEKVTTYLSCRKCSAAFPLNVEKRILHCANCGCAQLKDKCTKRTIAKALFLTSGEQVSLTIFDDKLVTLHNIYNPEAKVQDSSTFDEENITELLLSVEATIFYNKKMNVTSIKQKD